MALPLFTKDVFPSVVGRVHAEFPAAARPAITPSSVPFGSTASDVAALQWRQIGFLALKTPACFVSQSIC